MWREWAEPESNRRHMDFQSIALPAELSALVLNVGGFYGVGGVLQGWGRESKLRGQRSGVDGFIRSSGNLVIPTNRLLCARLVGRVCSAGLWWSAWN